jgi:hypothetical protein
MLDEYLETCDQQTPDQTLLDQAKDARRRIAALEKQQRRLLQQFGEGAADFPWSLVQDQINQLEREKETLLVMIAETEQRFRQQTQAIGQLEMLTDSIQGLARRLASLDFAGKRLALEELGVAVRANGRQLLEVTVTFPDTGRRIALPCTGVAHTI